MKARKITDKQRLDWMIEKEAFIGWNREGEYCNVWTLDLEEGTEFIQLTDPKKFHETPREAIDAAIRAERRQRKGVR